MSTVKDFLNSITKPAPELPDLEDSEHQDGTSANRPKETSSEGAAQDETAVERRRFRLVADTDEPKYAGKIVSSDAVFGSDKLSGLAQPSRTVKDSSDETESEADDESSGDEDEEGSEEDEMSDEASEGDQTRAATSDHDSDSSGKDDANEEESSDDDDEEEMNGEDAEEDQEEIKVDNALTAVNLEAQRKKGESIRKQLLIWDRLLHLHIKLHAALRAYNQLPRGDLAKKLLKEADEETVKNYQQVRKNTIALIQTLMQAEEMLLRSSKQTKGICGKGTAKSGMDDSEDEEIASSADEREEESSGDEESEEDVKELSNEDESEGDGDEKDGASTPDDRDGIAGNANGDVAEEAKHKGRHALKRTETELARRHKRFEEFRNATLKKWDERTRLVGIGAAKNAKSNFSGFESVVLKQITQIMNDKHRLIRRTQTKRSDSERIGGNPEATYDVELFDDDDFYQQLLKDLIERKSADVVDPIEMSKQWLEMQKLRQKRAKKKKVDTKASKGRKIRYVVIPKLVNYFPSAPEKVKWTHETRNQLFKSLFAS